jgi:hypothetical protein
MRLILKSQAVKLFHTWYGIHLMSIKMYFESSHDIEKYIYFPRTALQKLVCKQKGILWREQIDIHHNHEKERKGSNKFEFHMDVKILKYN